MLNLLLNIVTNIPFIYYFGIIGAATATLISNTIATIISIKFANKYAFFKYEIKKILIINLFIIISFVIVLLSELIINNINYQLILNFIFSFMLIGFYIYYGFYTKILISSNLKLIFTINDMK